MELTQVSQKIGEKIEELEGFKKTLPLLAQEKAETMAMYERAMASETVTLIPNHAISVIEKIARGRCADLRCKADLAESAYKNCLKIIDITEAQLNGYQSINRYLSET